MQVMHRLLGMPRTFREDRSGVTMLEYAIMGSLIAGMLVAGVPLITTGITPLFQFMADQIPAKTAG